MQSTNLTLFSSSGEVSASSLLAACRPYLAIREDPVVAYLPAASLAPVFDEPVRKVFHGLARVVTVQTELMTAVEMEAVLRQAALVYLPAGNCFLLNHRLHLCQIVDPFRKKISAGLPLVAFGAGTVLCGPNILTSNDLNTVPTSYFKGLEVTPFNLNVDYPDDEFRQAERDAWLADYFVFHDNPVLLMAENACVRVEGRKSWLEVGDAWLLRRGQEKERLKPGLPISGRP